MLIKVIALLLCGDCLTFKMQQRAIQMYELSVFTNMSCKSHTYCCSFSHMLTVVLQNVYFVAGLGELQTMLILRLSCRPTRDA